MMPPDLRIDDAVRPARAPMVLDELGFPKSRAPAYQSPDRNPPRAHLSQGQGRFCWNHRDPCFTASTTQTSAPVCQSAHRAKRKKRSPPLLSTSARIDPRASVPAPHFGSPRR
jgi:hypothetical protein